MLVKLDFKSSVPLYQQLKTGIVAGILSGEITEGDRLPSTRQLGRDLGINLHTVNKVYGILADQGYIHLSRNAGAVVNAAPALDKDGMQEFENVLLPLVIELRARDMSKDQYDQMMNQLWESSITATQTTTS